MSPTRYKNSFRRVDVMAGWVMVATWSLVKLTTSGKMVLLYGAVVVELSADEARTHRLGYATMDDAAEDIGAKREGDRFAIEDNPNSRWDHWTVGGRWGSTLKLLPGRQGYSAMPIEFDPEFAKVLNRPPPEIWQPTAYCDQSIGWVWRPRQGEGRRRMGSCEEVDQRRCVGKLG